MSSHTGVEPVYNDGDQIKQTYQGLASYCYMQITDVKLVRQIEGIDEVNWEERRGQPQYLSAPATLTIQTDRSRHEFSLRCRSIKLTEAVKQFGVPQQTLGDRICGRVLHGTRQSKFADFLVETSKVGYGKAGHYYC